MLSCFWKVQPAKFTIIDHLQTKIYGGHGLIGSKAAAIRRQIRYVVSYTSAPNGPAGDDQADDNKTRGGIILDR